MDNKLPKVSIVVPVLDEQENIPHFLSRLLPACQKLGGSYEIIFVNDGSTDKSSTLIKEAVIQNKTIKLINLSRTFGKEAALSAGLDHITGKSAILIDADLQDPPELICDLYDKFLEGYDVVLAVRKNRQTDSVFKRNTAKAFYSLFKKISDLDIYANAGDFRIMSRRVIDVVGTMQERTRFMKGILSWPGFKTTAIYYDREKRFKDKTKWKPWKLWNFALDGFFSFSTMPLRIWTYIGTAISLFAVSYLLFTIIKTMIYGIDVPGYASLLSIILFLGGINLIGIGIVGEYIGRIFEEVKQRPIYVIESTLNGEKIDD